MLFKIGDRVRVATPNIDTFGEVRVGHTGIIKNIDRNFAFIYFDHEPRCQIDNGHSGDTDGWYMGMEFLEYDGPPLSKEEKIINKIKIIEARWNNHQNKKATA